MADTKRKLFYCPEETLPVSWSVHLARLAAFYPKCFDCPLRCETGHLSPQTVERLHATERSRPRSSLLSEFGIRGVYLNELNRFHVSAYLNAFVQVLSSGRIDGTPKRSLSLAIGYQPHSAAPDLTVGVVNALRAGGVRIVDVGLTVGPLISSAIADCNLDGGVLITGSRCNPAWIGLDFLGSQGVPLADRTVLESIEKQRTAPTFRLPEGEGGYSTYDPAPSYDAELRQRFHALRPLRVILATPLQIVRELAGNLFESLPCSLELLSLPQRRRELQNPNDPDLLKLGEQVRKTSSHLGFLIDDDDRTCAVIDETGQLVASSQWSRLLLNNLTGLEQRDNRIWETSPNLRCDALLTLAHLLAVLSHSDADLSKRATNSDRIVRKSG